jgi:hypothetical protein
MEQQLTRMPPRGKLADAIRYAPERCPPYVGMTVRDGPESAKKDLIRVEASGPIVVS